ncbi:hypothetical protein GCM10010082_24470 [Kushneria pakistanensis]|uniref:Phosphate ABC transporter substrate-binding protein n=1 Tax=Kushneria pakistanensis TaxID=1508770 RepID=A0ABQ3FM21_9GAMM|nr:hypothetical protein [Kushneria pakistanensis]GHC29696.1 hypothetical protein GCM10010082_24470 [Kushneria pakistanensis]
MTRFMRLTRVATVAMLVISTTARADIAIVINDASSIRQISHSEAVNIFMGRYRRLPNDSVALPIDQAPLKARFYKALVQKDMAEINSYWARLVFSGRASPPQQAGTYEDLVDIVTHNNNALGYVDATQMPAHMHVLLTLSE